MSRQMELMLRWRHTLPWSAQLGLDLLHMWVVFSAKSRIRFGFGFGFGFGSGFGSGRPHQSNAQANTDHSFPSGLCILCSMRTMAFVDLST